MDATDEAMEGAATNLGDSDPGDPLLEGLTDAQREAVLHTEGALLILAGPGSGKTRVITRRIAHLVRMGVPAWSVLALTFTNKAAGEMRERVHALLAQDDRSARGLTVTTFHSLCARLLRRWADLLDIPGLSGTFSIYDSADQAALMKRVIAAEQLSATNFPPASVLWHVSRAKNELKDCAAFEREAHDFHSKVVSRLYRGYDKALRAANALDFDDLLMLTERVLRTRPEARAEARARWQYLMIDEYQDTNRAQFALARWIAEPPDDERAAGSRANICVVGDPDQSIYGWRGADITNILEFEERFPDAAVITLGENFRSTAPILAVADTLIRRNKRRKHKALFTSRSGGPRPEVVLCRDEHHEARVALDWIRARSEDDDTPWREMAVFYRTNALSRVMEDALRAGGVPYVIARGTAFFDREEVKDALAYLRVLANPADDVSLLRIVNKPARGIGDASLDRVETAAAARGVPVLEMMRGAAGVPGVAARAAAAMSRFVEMLDRWSGQGSFMGMETGESLAALVERVVKDSGLEKLHSGDGADRGEGRLENLAEVVTSAAEFEHEHDPEADAALSAPPGEAVAPPLLSMLRGYLESVSLVADADAIDPENGAVTLMTLHAAKGLEFRAVVMIGLEEGLLPHSRSRESEAELEEERRLCFVGITRARERLLMTCARQRTLRGVSQRTIQSQFVAELGDDQVVVSDQGGGVFGEDDWAAGGDVETPWGGGSSRASAGSGGGMPVGAMVRHPQFGKGRVLATSGRGEDAKARVEFFGVGVKTLVLKYARLERL